MNRALFSSEMLLILIRILRFGSQGLLVISSILRFSRLDRSNDRIHEKDLMLLSGLKMFLYCESSTNRKC